jgi:hypothetical protein
LPYNSTDIYPLGWCNNNGLEAISLLSNNKEITSMAAQETNYPKEDNLDEDSNSNTPGSPSGKFIIKNSVTSN